jgi:hypothetical protein
MIYEPAPENKGWLKCYLCGYCEPEEEDENKSGKKNQSQLLPK